MVRAILYDWDWPKHRMSLSEKVSPEKSRSKRIREKYHLIVGGLKEDLGEPTSHKVFEEDFYRESYGWNQIESRNAYIFMLGDKRKNFYRLRLVTYE